MTLNKPIKIVFVLPTLFAGGSERIISYLAQNIDKNKFDATLIVVGYAKDSAYEINNINIIFLEKKRVLNGIPQLFKQIKKLKPDIVLSVISHLNTVMAYISILFPKTKFIARESTVLSVDESIFNEHKSNTLLSVLGRKRFSFFDKIICQSKDMLTDIENNYNLNNDKLIVINNPITNTFTIKEKQINNNPIRLITVGRLSKEKGIPRILKLLSKLKIPFHFTLIGDGPDREEIIILIQKLNLQDKITHIPFTKEVEKYLIINDYFLQGSYVEGFPNALLESCVIGTPVIAFNVPGGTKEIVINNVNGFLVNDEDEFIEKLQTHREWNPKTISDSVLEKFSKRKIIGDYEQLFLEVIK